MVTTPDSRKSSGHRLLVISGTADINTVSAVGSAWDLARRLSLAHDVILAVPEVTGLSHPRFAVVYYNRRNIGLLVRDSDIAVFGRGVFTDHPALREMGVLRTAPAPVLMTGNLDSGSPFPVEGKTLDEVAQDELFLLEPYRPAVATGISLYIKRFRRRLHWVATGRTAARGRAKPRGKNGVN
ncbi:MAG: hypothetical protein ACYCXF_06365 [Thermoleophilia bacterium]